MTSDLRPHNNSYNSDSKKTAIKVGLNIFDSSLCYIQAGKKSLKILGALIRNTANLKKTLLSDHVKMFMSTIYDGYLYVYSIHGYLYVYSIQWIFFH